MVRLEKIVIQGFKSFKRNVSINFPSGFSVITGPNGCGKSNVGDSISFVIGKASSRVMRAKKSQELIFHGGKSKGASEYAKVTLYFDNSDKILPFKDPSVSISRRLNSKGVSTYRLNGKIATRQEILDVFSQAGIHANGHNIIQQGDVTQVVEMDPVERREIIDEISGIKEYDEKKTKALQELEKIAEKVREAELILTEKFSILDKLQKERDAAVKYKGLESDLGKIRASILWNEYSDSEKSLEEVVKKAEDKEKENQGLEKEIKDYDAKLAEEENKLEDLTKEVLQASSQIEVTKRLSRVQSELEIKKDRLESHRREIDRISVLMERLSATDRKYDPAVKAVMGMEGVFGVFADLVKVPRNYRVAFEVASGGHLNDIVVDSAANAVKAVNYLKHNRIGRCRFLPLDKLNPYGRKALPQGAVGWMSELVHNEPRYTSAVEFVLGSTACVSDIEKAKHIFSSSRVRMVTLDGDLIESSGAITGGFYKKRESADLGGYESERKRIESEMQSLEADIIALNKEMEILAAKETKTKTINMERDKAKIDESLKRVREKRKEAYEKRLILQTEIGKLNIQKARLEAKFDNLKVQLDQGPKESQDTSKLKPFIDMEVSTLKGKERECIVQIEALGLVNMKAIEDFEIVSREFKDFREKVDRIVHEKGSIEDAIRQIEEKRMGTFTSTLEGISKNFKEVYKELTHGEADLSLEVPNQLDSGLAIRASPPGKRLINIDSMSGGEKTLTAFAFLFAIQRHKPTPFYILDEADAALDKVNSKRVAELIKKQSRLVQFIVISHNDHVVREADQIYGVSMEDGESKVIAIELPKEVEKQAAKVVAEAPQIAGKNN
jgi:chromosome segregation protein